MDPRRGPRTPPVASWSSYSQGGQIEVAVWENVGPDRNGKERMTYSVTMTRSYKQDDGEYRRTKSLFSGDVPVAIVLLQVAMAWIIQNQARSTDPQFPEQQAPFLTGKGPFFTLRCLIVALVTR